MMPTQPFHSLPLAEATSRVTYELARFQSYTERWHYLVLGLIVAAIVVFVIAMYRRDSVELRPGMGVLLAALRFVALGGVLAYYCNLEKRTEQPGDAKFASMLLVDTSVSMGLHDTRQFVSARFADAAGASRQRPTGSGVDRATAQGSRCGAAGVRFADQPHRIARQADADGRDRRFGRFCECRQIHASRHRCDNRRLRQGSSNSG